MDRTKTSRLLSFILRHHPEKIGIELDEHGWANVDELLAGMGTKGRPMSMEILQEIVRSDAKGRYSFNEDKTLIRANQGHSIPVDVELEKLTPPAILYHGTGEKNVASINVHGLLPRGRLYVHLSSDIPTARIVGARHGKPVVYTIDADRMHKNGIDFYRSVNGVWLAKHVPPDYLRIQSKDN